MGSPESRTTSLQVGGVDLWLAGCMGCMAQQHVHDVNVLHNSDNIYHISSGNAAMSHEQHMCCVRLCVMGWDVPWLVQQHMAGDVHVHTTRTSCIELHSSHPMHSLRAAGHSASCVALILDIH
jgi:hypothetical protein